MSCRNEEISINKPNNFLMLMKIKPFMFAAWQHLRPCSLVVATTKTKPTVTITEREEILSRANIR